MSLVRGKVVIGVMESATLQSGKVNDLRLINI